MSRTKSLRKVVVDGETYLWKVQHDHKVLPPVPPRPPGACGCPVQSNSPLIVDDGFFLLSDLHSAERSGG